MSAPNTNIERQKKNHRGPLVGIAAVLVVVGLALLVFLGDETDPDGTLLGEGAATSAPEGVETTTSD